MAIRSQEPYPYSKLSMCAAKKPGSALLCVVIAPSIWSNALLGAGSPSCQEGRWEGETNNENNSPQACRAQEKSFTLGPPAPSPLL